MIPVYQPCLDGREKEYVNQCLDSTWISSKGEFITRFEHDFAKYVDAPFATTVSNGTVALHLALVALGVGPGDEVIVPTLTYIASVNTILQTGAIPVYVDADKATWNLDIEDLQRKITSRTRAVMVVHLYGLPCDMDSILKVCRENNLLLVEDCAEAFGAKYKGRHVGTFGDAATFSFFGNKTITTGEGGMVLFRNQSNYKMARHLKSQGVSEVREYWHDTLAYNYRMTNICAAIGVAQLERADEILRKKWRLAKLYQQQLSDLDVKFQEVSEVSIHSYWMNSIMVETPGLRDDLRKQLRASGVETRPLFPPAHTMPHTFSSGDFPASEYISARGMNLPSYPDLTDNQIEFICDVIKRALVN